MSSPIELSLAGDGRVVILTPQTVRKAFFQFTKVNPEYTGRDKYRLALPLHHPVKLWKRHSRSKKVEDCGYNPSNFGYFYRPYWNQPERQTTKWKESEATLLDGLHRYYLDPENLLYFHPKNIRKIENEINSSIIFNDLALVEDEGRLLEGYGLVISSGKNMEKVKYIRRYGMIFIVESIKRETVLRREKLDLFLQNDDFDFHLVRYQGVLLSKSHSCIQLLFHHRLDFSRTWTCTLAQFQPRQIFQVKRIYPCPGFRIVNYS